jgi:hypothetical protein
MRCDKITNRASPGTIQNFNNLLVKGLGPASRYRIVIVGHTDNNLTQLRRMKVGIF